jgi:hypothetical protein
MLALVGLMLTLGLLLSLVGQAPTTGNRLLPNPKVPAEQTIDVGLHISNIYNLSLRDKTFTADGWYWLSWPEAVQQLIDREQIPVQELVEFPNQVERWDSTIEPVSKQPERTADGSYLQLFSFSGRFYDDHQNLRMFPFEQLELPISIETRPPSFSMANKAIVLRPDPAYGEVLGDSVDLNGYSVSGLRVEEGIHRANSGFGERGDLAKRYSRVSYVVNYRTNIWSAFYTFVVPWLTVMAIVLLAPSLTGELKDVRLAIPSTALLTFVFLRESSTSSLPPLDYLTYIDKLYIMGFIASTVLFCLFVWSSNLLSRVSPDQEAATAARISRVDKAYQLSVAGSITIMLLVGMLRS